jgi:hypothetical protein
MFVTYFDVHKQDGIVAREIWLRSDLSTRAEFFDFDTYQVPGHDPWTFDD